MKWRKIFLILVILASSITLVVSLPSGLHWCVDKAVCGLQFWGAHEHDGIWHLAVSENILQKLPFELPVMSGKPLAGYNYLLDLLIACLVKIFSISPSFWYFQIIPICWLVGMIILTLKFARRYRPTFTYPIFLLFITFFGSSLGYLITIWRTGSISGSSSILAMQPMQNLLNLQFALSLLPFLVVLTGLVQGRRKTNDYVRYAICLFVALGLKFYTGIVMGLMLGYEMLSAMLSTKKFKPYVIPILLLSGSSLLAIGIFYYSSTRVGLPLIWKPLATVRPIIEDSTLFYWPAMANRLYSPLPPVSLVANLIALGIFLIFNFGTRILGLLGLKKKDLVTTNDARKIIILGIISSLLLSILFVQAGVWWNTVQFLYVSLFLTGILAAEGFDRMWLTNKIGLKIFVVIAIALTIPANLDILRTYTSFPGTSYLGDSELSVLKKLGNDKDGIIFVPLFTKNQSGELPARYDTAYVSAYTGKQTYLADLIQLELTQVVYADRLGRVANFDCEILDEVRYLYERSDNPYTIRFEKCGKSIEKIFGNETASYYRVE